jgi:hypothetical protein
MDQVHTTISDMTIDNHYMTREFLEKSLVDNLARIKELEELATRIVQRSTSSDAERNRMREDMQEWTFNELENGQITDSQAEEISEICGFLLTKEFEVEVTVTYNMTVNAKNEDEAESIANDIDFDTISYDDESISYLSSSVDRVSF